jgi:hypothetical protein
MDSLLQFEELRLASKDGLMGDDVPTSIHSPALNIALAKKGRSIKRVLNRPGGLNS